jgi:hypothetical protein
MFKCNVSVKSINAHANSTSYKTFIDVKEKQKRGGVAIREAVLLLEPRFPAII